MNWNVKTITFADSPYLLGDDVHTLRCDTTAGNIIVNLKAASTMRNRIYVFKKLVAGNTVTVTPNGAETIDGAATLVQAAALDVDWIQSNGASWNVL